MAKVTVTGGAGFVGSHLVEELAKTFDVMIIDDLSTGTAENIAGAAKNGKVELARASVLDLETVSRLIRGSDYVFHQAALPSVARSVENPLPVNQVNILGTLNVLMAARSNGVKKVVFASSSSVYGDTLVLPKVETMLPSPQSPYAVTKVAGEYYCQAFQSVYQLPTVCLRYFNVYGPRQNPNSQYSAVIPKFIVRMMEGKSPVIFGDGQQTRDFTFIGDVVQANILAATSEATGVFNIGSGDRVTINELVKTIGRAMGKDIAPEYEGVRKGDVRDSLASIERARSFGYRPRYTLEAGLDITMRALAAR